MRRLSLLVVVLSLLAGCTEPDSDDTAVTTQQPDWVETVYPKPGATIAVPDAVRVDHAISAPEEDVRLVIDGTDVTTYAAFEAGRVRYESGDGPVVLSDGEHWAEVQRVTLPADEIEYAVLDSFRWEFRVG